RRRQGVLLEDGDRVPGPSQGERGGQAPDPASDDDDPLAAQRRPPWQRPLPTQPTLWLRPLPNIAPKSRTRWAGVPPEDRRAERRSLLLDAGFDLLGSEGWAGTTVRAVCQ